MWYCGAGEGDSHQIFLGRLNPLLYCQRHFPRLTSPEPNDPAFISDHYKGRKRQVLAAFDYLGDSVDRYDLILQIEARCIYSFHVSSRMLPLEFPLESRQVSRTLDGIPCPLKLQASFPGCFGQTLYSPVVDVSAPVKHNTLDSLFLCPLGNDTPDFFCGSQVSAAPSPESIFGSRRSNYSRTRLVIHELCVNVLQTTIHRQPWPLAVALHFGPYSFVHRLPHNAASLLRHLTSPPCRAQLFPNLRP